MPLPKALLCPLGDYDALSEENQLRQAGFATAVLHWKDLVNQNNDWMQLSGVLDDPAVHAWVIAGSPAEFTDEVLCRLTLLALSLRRQGQPGTAFVLNGDGPAPALPPVLSHAGVWRSGEPFAARLMAARFRPEASLRLPFHVRTLLSPLVGLWLEVTPAEGRMAGFTVGVLDADMNAFGVGPAGSLPTTSRLAYPLLGIRGTLDDHAFCACAAQNELSETEACFCKVEGLPQGVFLGDYLTEAGTEEVVPLMFLGR